MHRTASSLVPIPAALVLLWSGDAGLHGQTVSLDPPLSYALDAVPEVIATGDLNGDGIPDLAIANTGSGESGGDNVSVLLGRGDGSFNGLGPFPAGNRPEGLVLAFANDDQVLDAVTADFEGDSISILLGNGKGGLKPPVRIPIAGGPRFVAAEDLDGDGHTDFVTSNYRSNEVTIIRGRGRGRFAVQGRIPVDQGPEVVAIADLNGDEFPDLVTSNALGNSITPLAGGPQASFSAGPNHPVGRMPRFVVATDVNGDGLDDLIVARNGDDAVSIELNAGGLAFSTAETIAPSLESVRLAEPVYLALSDVTGDGLEDLLVTWARSKTFTVHARNAGGGFEAFWPVQTGDTPVGIAAADLNDDGAGDIVVTNALDDTASVYLTYAAKPGVVIDNDSPGTTRIGPWVDSTSPYQFGPGSLFSKDGTRYVWEAGLPAPGIYEVLLWWTVSSNRSPGVVVEVAHQDGSCGLLIDQRRGVGTWNSIGTFRFGRTAAVTLTSPQDGDSVSADAVRFRPVPARSTQPPSATVSVTIDEDPGETTVLDDGRSLALHGSVTVQNASRPQEWLATVVTPVGDGEESASIKECRLYVDSNGNGVHDVGDRQLGPPRSFESDIRAAVFDGFAQSLPPGSTTDFFVVCQIGRRVASGLPAEGGVVAVAALLVGLAVAARKCRARRLAFTVALVGLFVSPLALTASGCGGGGGGGGSGGGGPEPVEVELRLELTSLVVVDGSSRAPAPFRGLPAEGWKF
jgi:VCBS repeat protein/FG-GAP repeat protein